VDAEGATILVADDEPAVRLALAEALEARGYRVTSAANGVEAYGHLRRSPPDLAVLDVAMPGLPGDEVIRRVRFLCGLPELPLLAITGRADPEVHRRVLRAGASRILLKPFDLEAFLATVEELLAGQGPPAGVRLAYRDLPPVIPDDRSCPGLREALGLLLEGLDRHDPHGPYHSIQVSELAVMAGRELGLPRQELAALRVAGLLHDTAKLTLPPELLRGSGPLDESARSAIREHPVRSGELAARLRLPEPVVLAVRHHHERWDGGGYPEALAGEAIPRLARVLAGAEAYAAMTMRSCYREPVPPGLAARELEVEAGRQFDPAVAEVLVTLVRTPAECSRS